MGRFFVVSVSERLRDDLATRARSAGILPEDAWTYVRTTWRAVAKEMSEADALASAFARSTLSETVLQEALEVWRGHPHDPLKPTSKKGWKSSPKVVALLPDPVMRHTRSAALREKKEVDEVRYAVIRRALDSVQSLDAAQLRATADEAWVDEVKDRLSKTDPLTQAELFDHLAQRLYHVRGTPHPTAVRLVRALRGSPDRDAVATDLLRMLLTTSWVQGEDEDG